MSFASQSRTLMQVIIAGLLAAVIAAPAGAESNNLPVLTLRVSDTVVNVGDTNAWISVFLTNFSDTVAGFSMMLLLDRQDLIEFRTDVEDTLIDTTWQYCKTWVQGQCTQWKDTMIIDTVITTGAIDTTGTAMAGWELVSARSMSGSGYECKITALADKLGPPVRQGLPPSSQERALFRLKTRVYRDILDSNNPTVGIAIIDNLNQTSFSNPSGNLIGVTTGSSICDTLYLRCMERHPVTDSCLEWLSTTYDLSDTTVVDTFYRFWKCTNWVGGSCTHWADTTRLLADSIWIQPRPWTERNRLTTFYADGSLQIMFPPPCVCGDANGDKAVNVGDAVFVINYIFKSGPVPPNRDCADPNNDGFVNVGDAVFTINYIFKGGTPPHCLP